MPFLKPSDLQRGMENIEKASKTFLIPKCQEFASVTIKYLKSYWMKMDPELWNVYLVKTRTNNKAEGYNR